MNTQTSIALAIIASLAAAPADAGPKPIKGRYKCVGTITSYFTNDAGILVSPKWSAPIAAKMSVTKGAGTFYLDVLTQGSQVSIQGIFPRTYAPGFDLIMSDYSSKLLKQYACGCNIWLFRSSGQGTQNKNGRKVAISIHQQWNDSYSMPDKNDDYTLSCKR